MSPDARRRPINGVIAAAGTDLSHSIHGEADLDSAQPKKSHSVFPRRKKHPSRTEKPRWATVLSSLAKNIFLLAVLWIGQWIWRWTDGGFPLFPPLDYEGRISDVESSLKKTAKALQLQLEVVDVNFKLWVISVGSWSVGNICWLANICIDHVEKNNSSPPIRSRRHGGVGRRRQAPLKISF